MYYEERWIDGKFCWRTSPNGAWTAYTANELAHRYQAELQRAHDAQRALDALQAQLAECYRLSGADPDGNEDWRLAPHAVDEVKRLREESDKELDALQQRVAQLEGNRGKPIEQVDPRYWDANELRANNRLKADHITELCDKLTTLQADHARVLGLVQALPKLEGDELEGHGCIEDVECLWSDELNKAILELLKYRASLPAQPAQGARCDQCGTRLAHEDHKYDCPYMIVKRQHAEGETRA